MFKKSKKNGEQEARAKIYKYCSYQERCHLEVRTKLYEYGLNKNQVEELIVELISEDLLNEERFSRAYCRGKFLYNKWGRVKIAFELKARDISQYCIKAGMKEIKAELYQEQLELLADAYLTKHKRLELFQRKQKTAKYLTQKGYESDLIWEYLNDAKQ